MERARHKQGMPNDILIKFIGRLHGDVPLTEEESIILQQWLAADEQNVKIFEFIKAGKNMLEMTAETMNSRVQGWNTIQQRIQPGRRVFPLARWVAAAAVVAAIGLTYFWLSKERPVKGGDTFAQILPGRNTASLTLGNGSVVQLEERSGTVAYQGKTAVENDSSGTLSYIGSQDQALSSMMNVLRTPKGGQYRVNLPDGSLVWLNAASALRYPAGFGKDSRTVELEGEAYFEIAKDASRPFTVKLAARTGQMEVKVLGTHFNINGYADRPDIQTTLLEGSIEIRKGNAVRRIVPGDQAAVSWEGEEIRMSNLTYPNDAVAWKNGLFNYFGHDLKNVANDIARWYDVDLKFNGDQTPIPVFAVINREAPIDSVIVTLQRSDIQIRREGRTIIVGK